MGFKEFIRAVSETLFPYIPKCVCCGVEKGAKDYLCKDCPEKLEALKAGESRIGNIRAYSLYKYDGVVKSIITGYKYGGKRWLSRFMGSEMRGLLLDREDTFSFVCNVPLHYKKRKIRGFDQSEEIAKRVSEETGIPYAGALRRTRNTKTQTKLSYDERAENIKGAFEAAADISGNVLLIDDVLTTGATAGECASVLKGAGAQSVYVLTFAKSAYGKRVK